MINKKRMKIINKEGHFNEHNDFSERIVNEDGEP
jgi:hypothetical protein